MTGEEDTNQKEPLLSIILLDWSVRERFQALEWLNRQSAPRDSYELIWIELYDAVPDIVRERADVVKVLGQKGVYHKHKAYNEGLLAARGALITVCDSDAVFSHRFVESVFAHFDDGNGGCMPKVLMHHEWRTASPYPDGMTGLDELDNHKWLDLWPNVGACMTVRREDAIRFGGFDEHRLFKGYICGPYDLGWRLVNAGLPEVWQSPDIALWHFAHPDPPASLASSFSMKRWLEVRTPHEKYHALAAVEAFSSGRMLPRAENPAIFALRMKSRRIGGAYEEAYANLCGPEGFSRAYWAGKYGLLLLEGLARMARPLVKPGLNIARAVLRRLRQGWASCGLGDGRVPLARRTAGAPGGTGAVPQPQPARAAVDPATPAGPVKPPQASPPPRREATRTDAVTPGVLTALDPSLWREHRFGLPAGRFEALAGKTFWITGAGTGYGRALSIALACAGAGVALSGRRPAALEQTVREALLLGAETGRLHVVPLDVTDDLSRSEGVGRVLSYAPELSGIVHCAALPQDRTFAAPLLRQPGESIQGMWSTNFAGPLYLTREALERTSGAFRGVFMTSEAGWAVTPGMGPYNVSKAALNSMAVCLAVEAEALWPDRDIQLNVLDPGEAHTEMNQGSSTSPYSVACMTLALLSHPRPGPTGRFFHRDGRHLEYCRVAVHENPLL